MRSALALSLSVALALLMASSIEAVPNGFADVEVAPGEAWLDPVALQFAGDGRIFVAEQGGRIYILEPDPQGNDPLVDYIKLQPPFFDIEDEVLKQQDRGLLGFCLDPDFLNNGHIYVTYVVETDPGTPDTYQFSYSRIERFTVDSQNPNVIDMSSRLTLVGEDWALGPTSAHLSHTTGSLVFGDDGTLLYTHGDGAHYNGIDSGGRDPEQFLPGRSDPDEDVGAFRSLYHGSLSGKVLRIDPATGDGIPSNPYYDALNPRSDASRIWAEGLRNPFRMNIQRGSGSTNPVDANPGKLFISDVGWNRWEEVNVAYGGENFGWPCYEGTGEQTSYQAENPMHSGCPPDASGITAPEIEWPHSGISGDSAPVAGFSGNAATGIAWHDTPNFPPPYRTALFFSEYVASWINVAFYDEQGNITDIQNFANGLDRPVELKVDPDTGDLFYLAITTDEVRRIYFDGETGFGIPPSTPVGLSAAAASGRVTLSWDPNADLDIGGYNVYRQETAGGPKTLLTPTIVPNASFLDDGSVGGPLINGEVYYYSVEAVDIEEPPLTSPHSAAVQAIPSAKAWEFYLPAFGPTLTLPELPAAFPRIVDVPPNPAGSNYDHWGNANRAPLMRRVPLTSDWSIETRFTLSNFSSATNFHAGLMVQFGTYELYTWGPYRGTDLRLERSGQQNLANLSQSETTMSLRISKTGDLYSFEYRANDTDPWTVVDTINDGDSVLYVGAMTKTWAVNVPVTMEYEYIAIDELPPIASSSADIMAGPTPLMVQFSSDGSYDPDGDLLTHHWEFGDGASSTESNPLHQYSLPGDYPAVLTVRDGSGLEHHATAIDITAEGNHLPTATIVAPLDGYEYTDASATIALEGTGADVEDSPGSLIYDWSIDLHDSGGTTSGYVDPPSTPSSSFVPNTVDDGLGVWLDVILTVTDSGGLSDSDTVSVYDSVLPPQAVVDLRAAMADGAAPRTAGSAESPWVDLAGDNDAALLGFTAPGPGSGWAGSGVAADPHRIELDGIDDRLAISAGSPDLSGLSEASAEMWVRTGSDVDSRQYLLEWLDSFAPPFPGMTLSIFNRELQLYTGAWQTLAAIEDERWYHILLAKDGDDYRAYVDGVEVATGSGAQLGDAVSEVVIGAGTFPGPDIHADHFVGAFGELRIYDFALSPENLSVLLANSFASYVNAPRVTEFSPLSAPNDEVVVLDIEGRDFLDGATVRLTLAGESDRNASTTQFVDSAQLVADVDLTGAVLGDWELVVQNPDGQVDVADSLLSVIEPSTTYLHLWAAQAGGSAPPVVPGAASPWTDVADGHPLSLSNFAGDAGSGWQGDGSGADPFRLRFDGVDDVGTIPAASIPELQGTVHSTLEIWLRPGADVDRKQTVLEWVDDYSEPFAGASLVIENGELFARLGNDADRESFGPVGSDWIYCTLQQGAFGTVGHRDSALAFARIDFQLGDQNSDLVLGASTRGGAGVLSEYFEGEIAIVRLSGEALLPTAIAQIYTDELPLFTPEPMPRVSVTPTATQLPAASTLDIDLNFDDGALGAGLRGGSFQLHYDPACFDFMSAVEGELLASAGTTFFAADGGTPGVVSIDMTLLGGGLPIVTAGRLASVQLAVKGGAPEGSSPLSLDVASIVDVANPPQQLPHVILDSSVNLDFTPPAAVGALAATPTDGTTGLSWTLPTSDYAGAHAFYRAWETAAPFGYPDYAATPAWPADLSEARNPANEWTEVVLDANTTSLDLSQSERTVYSAFFCSIDAAGNLSPVAAAPRVRAPNYRLGDLGELDALGDYVASFDGEVDAVKDLVVLSKAYGLDSLDPNWIGQTDVGPTDTGTPVGAPQTDGLVDFEDLMIYSMDLPALSKRGADITLGRKASGELLRLLAGAAQPAGESGGTPRVELPLVLEGNFHGAKGLHLKLRFDSQKLRYLGTHKASSLQRAGLPALVFDRVEADVLTIDLAALGAGTVLEGDGVFLYLDFELIADLGGGLELIAASARRVNGEELDFDASGIGEASFVSAPLAYRLLANAPNPFNPATVIRFETPKAGSVSLRVYDLAGRLVRQIYRGDLPAGYHQMEWRGRDDRGATVASGTYLYELTVPGQRFVKKMMLLK